MKNFLICIALSLFSAGNAEPPPHSSEVLGFIKNHLLSEGVLRHSDGFVYVQLDNDFIKVLAPLVSDLGFDAPDYCEGEKVGAHITAIYPEEMKLFGIESIEEEGEFIPFEIKECQIVFPRRNFESAYLVIIESLRLDQIREKYGLGKREYAFHITIGVKAVRRLSSDASSTTFLNSHG